MAWSVKASQLPPQAMWSIIIMSPYLKPPTITDPMLYLPAAALSTDDHIDALFATSLAP
jgi:hypothetical protein